MTRRKHNQLVLVVCVATAVLCGMAMRTKRHDLWIIDGTYSTLSTKDGLGMAQYSIDHGALSYAVITGPYPPGPDVHIDTHVKTGTDEYGDPYANLNAPDGSETPILGTGRVFFVSGTTVTETPGPVPAKTFEDFIHKADVPDYSLKTLLDFQRTQKPAQ